MRTQLRPCCFRIGISHRHYFSFLTRCVYQTAGVAPGSVTAGGPAAGPPAGGAGTHVCRTTPPLSTSDRAQAKCTYCCLSFNKIAFDKICCIQSSGCLFPTEPSNSGTRAVMYSCWRELQSNPLRQNICMNINSITSKRKLRCCIFARPQVPSETTEAYGTF